LQIKEDNKMGYDYQAERPYIFTDEGQRQFLAVRDRANELATSAGAFAVHKALEAGSGDSWKTLACMDRLIELGEFRYVDKSYATQYWIVAPSIPRH
jgi:hypothetical protein